ncbi:MAG TPA: hypothetical protein VEX15_13700 [Nocardioidaceae bacterium]|nr:hypothetical protein [Nocardioidaceae bacterium]
MSDLDLKSRLESAVRPAYAASVDAEADLARGRRGRRRRRAGQLAAGTSVCAVAGAAAVAGLPALGGGGDADPSGDGSVTVATADPEGRQLTLDASDYKSAVRDHLGLELDEPYTSFGEDEPIRFSALILNDDRASLAVLRISDDVREGSEPVPALCADDPAYDTCDRRDLPDGTEVVVGRGDDDLLAVTWGRGGDLVEVAAHLAAGGDHDVTLDQLVDLVTDDRFYINSGRGFVVGQID